MVKCNTSWDCCESFVVWANALWIQNKAQAQTSRDTGQRAISTVQRAGTNITSYGPTHSVYRTKSWYKHHVVVWGKVRTVMSLEFGGTWNHCHHHQHLENTLILEIIFLESFSWNHFLEINFLKSAIAVILSICLFSYCMTNISECPRYFYSTNVLLLLLLLESTFMLSHFTRPQSRPRRLSFSNKYTKMDINFGITSFGISRNVWLPALQRHIACTLWGTHNVRHMLVTQRWNIMIWKTCSVCCYHCCTITQNVSCQNLQRNKSGHGTIRMHAHCKHVIVVLVVWGRTSRGTHIRSLYIQSGHWQHKDIPAGAFLFVSRISRALNAWERTSKGTHIRFDTFKAHAA